MIDRGEIVDAKTIIALFMADRLIRKSEALEPFGFLSGFRPMHQVSLIGDEHVTQ